MICSKCLIDKTSECFASRGNNQLHKQCKECKREAIGKHYQLNKEKYKSRAVKHNKKARNKIRQYIRECKNIPCMDCKKSFPHYVMDFDHLYDKKINVADIVKFCSMRMAKEEISKCEIVCSNCHRERTWQRHISQSREAVISQRS